MFTFKKRSYERQKSHPSGLTSCFFKWPNLVQISGGRRFNFYACPQVISVSYVLAWTRAHLPGRQAGLDRTDLHTSCAPNATSTRQLLAVTTRLINSLSVSCANKPDVKYKVIVKDKEPREPHTSFQYPIDSRPHSSYVNNSVHGLALTGAMAVNSCPCCNQPITSAQKRGKIYNVNKDL